MTKHKPASKKAFIHVLVQLKLRKGAKVPRWWADREAFAIPATHKGELCGYRLWDKDNEPLTQEDGFPMTPDFLAEAVELAYQWTEQNDENQWNFWLAFTDRCGYTLLTPFALPAVDSKDLGR